MGRQHAGCVNPVLRPAQNRLLFFSFLSVSPYLGILPFMRWCCFFGQTAGGHVSLDRPGGRLHGSAALDLPRARPAGAPRTGDAGAAADIDGSRAADIDGAAAGGCELVWY